MIKCQSGISGLKQGHDALILILIRRGSITSEGVPSKET